MSRKYFTGFSTINTKLTGHTTLYDIDLVKQDLMNHFQTRVGERLMRPSFGCAIWDYFMEPLTDYNKNAIIAEATRVCESDSRVSVVSVNVTELDSGVKVSLLLQFNPLNVIDSFTIDFEKTEAEASGLLLT